MRSDDPGAAVAVFETLAFGALIVLYSGGYLKGHPQQGRFLSFILLFMGAVVGGLALVYDIIKHDLKSRD